MLRHLFALAFLPPQEIPEAFNILKFEMPYEANEIVQWFEDNYVHGRIRRRLRNETVIRSAPLFPPQLWSVYNSNEMGFHEHRIMSKLGTDVGKFWLGKVI